MAEPKGRVFIIGGAEYKDNDKYLPMEERNKSFDEFEILKTVLPQDGKAVIELITTATNLPEEISDDYKKAFKKIGFNNLGIMAINDREEARDQKLAERIYNAHAVFFTGGDQFRLSTILGSTDISRAIYEKYCNDKNFLIAGTSAGSMALPKVMIYKGNPKTSLLMGEVQTTSGVGFFDNCIIDTHFGMRGRFARLANAVATNASCVGVGIDEDTALMLTKDNVMECYGSGMVTIIDGADILSTNIPFAENDTPLYVENLKVHLMTKGNIYLLKDRKFFTDIKELKASKIIKAG